MKLKHFSYSEFDSPDEKGSGANMDPVFLIKLDKARAAADVPFEINSGYRTEAHNAKVGGSTGSSHMKGFAADIRCENSSHRQKVLTALIKTGFTRIGIGATFIHVDADPRKSPAVWTYY